MASRKRQGWQAYQNEAKNLYLLLLFDLDDGCKFIKN